MQPVAAPTIDVSGSVTFDAVWKPIVCHGKNAAIDEEGLPGITHYVICVSRKLFSLYPFEGVGTPQTYMVAARLRSIVPSPHT